MAQSIAGQPSAPQEPRMPAHPDPIIIAPDALQALRDDLRVLQRLS